MKKTFLLVSATIIALVAISNGVKALDDNYTIVSTTDTTIGNLIKTDLKIQVGTDPLNSFKIHRTVKSCKKEINKGAIILLPGSSSSFGIFEIDENGIYENSMVGFFASQGYDVYGYSPRTENFGFGECSSGMVDCSIMKEWGYQTTLDDLEYLKTYIAGFHKNKKPVIMGWSLGAFHTIAAINAHPYDYSGAVIWEGTIYSKNTDIIMGNNFMVQYYDSLMEGGVYFDAEMEGLLFVLQLAVTDPDGLSPIPGFPEGTTNKQAFVIAVSTPQDCPPAMVPGYLYLVANSDYSGLKYSSFDRVIALGQAFLPYESLQELRDGCAAIAGDRTYTNNLHKFKAPIYVVGAGQGFGKYMKENIKLFGSRDVTWNYINNFGHADHYLSTYHRQILEYPILFWLNKVFRYPKMFKSAEDELMAEEIIPALGINNPGVFPNPASDMIMISYELPDDGIVSLSICDISGRKIMDLLNHENQLAGNYDMSFNVNSLQTGTYFYILQTEQNTQSGKLIIAR